MTEPGATAQGSAQPATVAALTEAPRLRRLLDLLLTASRHQNLTALRDPDEAWIRHILDSLAALELGLLEEPGQVVDVGAGAGFPGLPLAVARPELQLTAVEATARKCRFIEAAASALELRVRVVAERAETLGQDPNFRELFDVALARAVGSFSEVAELTLPLVKVGGHGIFWRGTGGPAEAAAATGALATLGGELVQVHPYQLPAAPLFHLVAIRKLGPTPAVYPRRPGVPHRKPLYPGPKDQPSRTGAGGYAE